MDINIVKKQNNLYKVVPHGNRIVEYSRDDSDANRIHISLFDPNRNFLEEVMPERIKNDYISIINGIWNCRDIYYSSYDVSENDKIRISIYRYSIESKTENRICYFSENADVFSGTKRIKAFVLSESAILLQTETRHEFAKEDMMGNIAFRLALCNLENGEVISVNDPNFINNGINTIVPLSDNKIMIKTGYSYLEDSRFEIGNEYEALIESVYITTAARFIADITLESESVDMNLIESTYFDRHITRPRVSGNYIHFCIIDAKNVLTKCVFYNIETNERLEYSISNINYNDLMLTYVINNIPYVKKTTDGVVNFINLRKAAADVFFYDEVLMDLYDDVLILMSKGRKRRLHIYSYPGLKQLYDEKREYTASCKLNDNYYIYC